METRRDATWDLLAAVYPLLNVAAFTGAGLATSGLFHGLAPQGTPPPYGVLQAPSSDLDLPAMQTPGHRVRYQLKAVSADPTFAEALLIVQAAIQILDGVKPVIANHLVLRHWWESTRCYAYPELVNGVPVYGAVSQWCALVDQVS